MYSVNKVEQFVTCKLSKQSYLKMLKYFLETFLQNSQLKKISGSDTFPPLIKALDFCFQIQGHSRTFKFCTNPAQLPKSKAIYSYASYHEYVGVAHNKFSSLIFHPARFALFLSGNIFNIPL